MNQWSVKNLGERGVGLDPSQDEISNEFSSTINQKMNLKSNSPGQRDTSSSNGIRCEGDNPFEKSTTLEEPKFKQEEIQSAFNRTPRANATVASLSFPETSPSFNQPFMTYRSTEPEYRTSWRCSSPGTRCF